MISIPLKKVNDDEILRYLENHTYDETQAHFSISRMTISRVKARNKAMFQPNDITIAIIGMGNLASALIQGIEYYKSRKENTGILHPTLAGYHLSDIIIVAAIDVSSHKVGKPLEEAIKYNKLKIRVPFEQSGIEVSMGVILDGVIDQTRDIIAPAQLEPANTVKLLKDAGTEIVVCLLPSGSDKAVKYYAKETLKAGCAFINATPTNIANDPRLSKLYSDAGLPLIGDDLQDQWGATILHKLILSQMIERGIKIDESYALDVGGGPESLNTIHRTRHIKKDIKSKSVIDVLNINAPIVAGTSDYVPHLNNSRNTMLWIKGKGYLGSDIKMDIKIQTEDGPNGGSILADIIRATKIALLQQSYGPIGEISAYGFKNPPKLVKSPEVASANLADFIMGGKIQGGRKK